MEILQIPLDRILVGTRLRSIDGASVDLIAASFAERGQDTPITVGPPDPLDEGMHPLIAGAHRVAAARMLGWEGIAARVFAGNDDEAKLLEIDENLMRRELGALDRAVFLAERQEVYERLNPTLRGRPKKDGQGRPSFFAASFSKATAAKLGLDRRNIDRALKRAGLPARVRERLAGRPVADSGQQLDALLRLNDDDQMAVVEALTRAKDPARNVAAALAEQRHMPPRDPEDVQFERLTLLWSRTHSARARARFLAHIGAAAAGKVAA